MYDLFEKHSCFEFSYIIRMIVYNTTFQVDSDIQEEFVEYLLQKFIPACTKSGLLTSPRLARVFGTDEDEGISFAIEFTAKDLFTLEKWNNEESYSVHAPLIEKFREKIAGFSTILQTIEY